MEELPDEEWSTGRSEVSVETLLRSVVICDWIISTRRLNLLAGPVCLDKIKKDGQIKN